METAARFIRKRINSFDELAFVVENIKGWRKSVYTHLSEHLVMNEYLSKEIRRLKVTRIDTISPYGMTRGVLLSDIEQECRRRIQKCLSLDVRFYKSLQIKLESMQPITGNKNRDVPINGKTIFLAMPFSQDSNPTFTAIEKTVRILEHEFSYIKLDRIDKRRGASFAITPEILKSIKDSRIVIADLTESRPNVYFEAGFARACERDIIYICKNPNKPHFDLQGESIRFFDNEIDLMNILEEDIRVILEANI